MNGIFRAAACLTQPWRIFLQTLLALFALSLSQAATAAVSTLTSGSDVNPSVLGQTVTLSGTVQCPGFTPTGTASIFQNVILLGVVPLNGAGVASLSTSALPIGPNTITVIYNGDINCDPAASSFTQTVNQIATTTSLTSTPNPSVYGQTATLTATVAPVPPGAGTATGTVTFFDGATSLGTATLNGGGMATLSTSTLTVGSHLLTAVYGGDTNSSGSTSAPATQVVNPGSTTTTLTSSLNPSSPSQAVTFTATVAVVAPAVGVPTGSVSFFNGATLLGTATLNGAGLATFTTSSLAAATTHSITATYSGDAAFGASTSAILSQVVSAAVPTLGTSAQLLLAAMLAGLALHSRRRREMRR